jgi:hypothetical protein
VAGTHGRGFWILDDVTPLRQAAEAAGAGKAYLFKPATGIRVRFATNDPTPWPPELPAGENPPPGAIVDYYLPAASDAVKLEFLNALGKVVRTYSSSDAVRHPDPATDPAGYDKICQQTPSAADCALPLYWPAPPQVLKTSAGMHRFTWDMHYDPTPGVTAGRGGGGGANGAVPHRTYPGVVSPWVAPGVYTVRLTAGGQTQSQPITIVMDPRVKVTPDVQQIFAVTARIENDVQNAANAWKEALGLIEKVKARPQSASNDALLKKLEEIAPEKTEGTAETPTLSSIGSQLIGAVMPMQAAEMAPTAVELEACKKQEAAYAALMTKWAALKGGL